MNENNKPNIFKSILFVIPCFFAFLLSQVLSAIILSGIFIILNAIPIIGNILEFIVKMRGEPLTITITLISISIAYYLTTFIQDKMIKVAENKKLSRKILGVIIAIIHLLSLIINITSKGNILANIISFIAGLVFIFNNDEQ